MSEQPTKRAKTERQAVADHAPWKPVKYELADAGALQALMKGDASKDQQQRALKFVIENIAGAYDEPYRPGGEEGSRDTVFALGRAYVGRQIVKLLKLNLSVLRKENNNA